MVRTRSLIAILLCACASPSSAPQGTSKHWWQTATPASQVPVGTEGAPAPDAKAGDAKLADAKPVAAKPGAIAATYRETANQIIAAATRDRGAYEKLAYLTDRIGHRLAGSPQYDQAVTWAVEAMKADGHEARTEKVTAIHWQRGAESAELIAPVRRPLTILGLGNTISTPKAGITAPVVVIRSWKELDEKKDRIKGAIVLYDVAMAPWNQEIGSGYGPLSEFRWKGGDEAAKRGAVGVLMRSITAHSLQSPHTGTTGFLPDQRKVPSAAVTVEDAQLIARLAEKGEVKVKLMLQNKMLGPQPSHNVIGELRGREKPDEVVVIGAHLDSWDVGQGAHDDGAGVTTMMQAITVLRQLGLQPRRTIRVVLFSNEENGLGGARGYAETHKADAGKHVMALESDSGGFAPRGFRVDVPNDPPRLARVKARALDIAALLAPINATRIVEDDSGADVGELVKLGVVGLGLDVAPEHYFDYHHTHADTLDKVKPEDLAADVAAVAVMAYVVADLPGRLDE